MMDWNTVSILSAACIFVGIGLTFSNITTFIVTPYNEIHLSGQSGLDQTDTPYTLSIIETVLSGLTVILAMITIAVPRKIDRNVITIVLIYFIAATIMEAVMVTTRLSSLGMIGTNVVGTCSDRGVDTGCPTTRFEEVHARKQLYTTPLGGDCQFFYWDSMKTRAEANSCQSQAPDVSFESTCNDNIENHMNWANPESYGWGDNPKAVSLLPQGSQVLTSVDKIHNPSNIMSELQIQYSTEIITQISNATGPPAIAHCYYWGCSSVCNTHRYIINRQWLWSSVILLISHALFALISALLCRRAKSYTDSKEEIPVASAYTAVAVPEIAVPEKVDLQIPEFGRRKRRLMLSGLRF